LDTSNDQSVLAFILEQKKNMITIANPEQTIGQRSEISLQRQWPQLGRELFTLESALLILSVLMKYLLLNGKERRKKQASGKRSLLSFIAMRRNIHLTSATALY